MLATLARNWWMFAVRGVAAIIFGVLAFFVPGLTLAVLILFFGAYAIVDGAAILIGVVRHGREYTRHRWAFVLIGILGIIAGIITFFYPGLTALTLLYVVAIWSIVMGITQIVAAIHLRREIKGELWLGLGGVLAIVFGVLLILSPGAGLLALVWLVGIWAIFFGVSSLLLALKLRNLHERAAAPA